MKENVIIEKTFTFSIEIIRLYSYLLERKEFVLSKQLLRSATSMGANVEETIAGQSRKDFISKMTIASKETRETRYWLRVMDRSQIVKSDFSNHVEKIDEMIRIITSIVKTSQRAI